MEVTIRILGWTRAPPELVAAVGAATVGRTRLAVAAAAVALDAESGVKKTRDVRRRLARRVAAGGVETKVTVRIDEGVGSNATAEEDGAEGGDESSGVVGVVGVLGFGTGAGRLRGRRSESRGVAAERRRASVRVGARRVRGGVREGGDARGRGGDTLEEDEASLEAAERDVSAEADPAGGAARERDALRYRVAKKRALRACEAWARGEEAGAARVRRVSETSSSAGTSRFGDEEKLPSVARFLSREHQALVGHEASSSLDLIRVADQNRLLTWQTRFECVKIEDLIGGSGSGQFITACSVRSSRAGGISANHGPPSSIFPCSAESALRFSAPEFDDDLIFESNSPGALGKLDVSRRVWANSLKLDLVAEETFSRLSTRKATPPLETCFGGGGVARALERARPIEASTAISQRDHRSRAKTLSVPSHSRIRTPRVAFSAGICVKRQKADVLFARERVSLRANADWLLRRAPDARLKRARATRRALR